MDPTSALALVGTVATVINNVGEQIMTIKSLHDQIKTADVSLMSFVAQLNSIKAALGQIEQLLKSCDYDEQLQADLELSLQACDAQMAYVETKLAALKTKNASTTLRLRSKIRVVFESEDMDSCLQKLSHQATALNLLITVLTSKSVMEQRNMLQRNSSRRVFRQVQEDKQSVLDEAASLLVMRDGESVLNAQARLKAQPIIAKSPWKRFTFDPQVLRSRVYSRKAPQRIVPGNALPVEEPGEMDENFDDAVTLTAETETGTLNTTGLPLSLETDSSSPVKPARFSKMLAFGDTNQDITNLVSYGQELWDAPATTKASQALSRTLSRESHRLTTKYFDMTIQAHTLEEYDQYKTSDDLLSNYKDVSCILFAVNLIMYRYNDHKLERDLELFRRTANDYHLLLAKIILFFNTTDLDPYSAHNVSEDVKQRFMQAGKAGATDMRIHAVVGEVDERAAGTIFAVANENERIQRNKWSGLSKSPTY